MSVEENKALTQRFYDEVINQDNLDNIEEFVNDDIVENNPAAKDIAPGLEGFRQELSYVRSAFPDLRMEIKDIIGEGEKVAYVLSFTGTHQGEFWGVEPTGNKIDTTIIDYMTFEDGKLSERTGLFDVYELMQQLGQKAA